MTYESSACRSKSRSAIIAVLLSILLVALNNGSCLAGSTPAFAEITPFLNKGESLLAVSTADLNGDGLSDYLVVVEKPGDSEEGNLRELLLVIRQKDRSLRVVKRNGKIVMCSRCGGGWGDPFSEDYVTADTKTFAIENYGGVSNRWSENYKFNYSRRDKT